MIRYRLRCATWYVVRESAKYSPRILSDPESAALLANLAKSADDDKEHMWAILLNTLNRYLLHTLVSMGTQSASLVHPREVLGPALCEGAASIVLIHNHPSGDPTPSREDLRLTRQLAEAARLLDVTLHDHIIVGSGTWTWVSMAQRGAL
jgi:DNA repair protein RadC